MTGPDPRTVSLKPELTLAQIEAWEVAAERLAEAARLALVSGGYVEISESGYMPDPGRQRQRIGYTTLDPDNERQLMEALAAYDAARPKERAWLYDAQICACGHRYGVHAFRALRDSPCSVCACLARRPK